jgi:hypothetical protein
MGNTVETVNTGEPPVPAGMYLAEVVSHLDTTYNGMLEVRLIRYVSNANKVGQTYPAKYMSPFYGVTPQSTTSQNNDFANTQKSYGMWMIPPDVGTMVMVVFVQNDPKFAYWVGCVPEENMNFMIPGVAATDKVVDETGRLPVGEYNRKVNDGNYPDTTKIKKPKHPFADVLDTQGLLKDDVRGLTTSSARREQPSSVFGISTPGPVDRDGPSGKVGLKGRETVIPVNRLGGTTFVMDDGDNKFLRKKLAGEGPPEYARVENEETDGNAKILHNELVRIRTRTGHQILLHNSEDLIYIGNAKGTTWIELTSNGKIDIYAEDSISLHTKNDLNIKADRDINLEAGRNVNIKATNILHAEATNIETVATVDTKITSGATSHVNSKVTHLETAGKIYMNSKPVAVAAKPLTVHTNPTEIVGSAEESIMLRVPSHEPWPHHENLDPLSFTPDKTDISKSTAIPPPSMWTLYTAINDTFDKLLPASKQQQDTK